MKELESLLNDFIESEYILKESNKWKTYFFNGNPVPRVSNILSDMINKDFSGWAVFMKSKGVNYKDVINESANIGTHVHNLIEEFTIFKIKETEFKKVEPEYKERVMNAYYAYLDWYNKVSSCCKLEILETEKELVCPYVGGTMDCLVSINGKKYIIDYKTSNHISFTYFIQLAAYKYMLENFYNTPIDGGVIILLLNKKSINFMEYTLDLSIPEHKQMIYQSEETFLSLLYAFYNRYKTEELFKSNFKGNII